MDIIKGKFSTNHKKGFVFLLIDDSDIQLSVRLNSFFHYFFLFLFGKYSIMIDNPEEQLQRVVNRLRKVVEDYSAQVNSMDFI